MRYSYPGGYRTARDAARTLLGWWGEAEAPWYVPDCGQVRPMERGTRGLRPADASALAVARAVLQGCEPPL